MTVTAPDGVYYDPYDVEINADPYQAFRAIREEAPLYYNQHHDFYALSRFADVDRALVDHETFSSARGAIIELIKANIDIPPGVIIFENPPIHDVHRKLLARMFTPRKIAALEGQTATSALSRWIHWSEADTSTSSATWAPRCR